MNSKHLDLWRGQLRHKRWVRPIFLLFLTIGLLGCSNEPQVVEVTRVVHEEVPVTVAVAQVATVEVPIEVTVEVPVEVTRLVEVVVTSSVLPTEADTAVPTETAAPTETATAVVANSIYTVKPGDNLAVISNLTGVPAAEIMAANNLTNQNFLQAGQELTIPGWDGALLAVPTVISTATVVVPTSESPAPSNPTGGNLLVNGSFEGDWYFFNNTNELQIPVGWSVYVDEGPNTLTADPDDVFFRPEIRVVPAHDLPADEVASFVFNGEKTIKAFKGGGPVSFAIFTDIALPAGSYRFSISFFPDIVSIYQGGNKVWATDPEAAEARIIMNSGGTAWATTNIATKNTVTYDFSLAEPTTVRLGGAFRNRYVNGNNGWFLDDWQLYRLGEP